MNKKDKTLFIIFCKKIVCGKKKCIYVKKNNKSKKQFIKCKGVFMRLKKYIKENSRKSKLKKLKTKKTKKSKKTKIKGGFSFDSLEEDKQAMYAAKMKGFENYNNAVQYMNTLNREKFKEDRAVVSYQKSWNPLVQTALRKRTDAVIDNDKLKHPTNWYVYSPIKFAPPVNDVPPAAAAAAANATLTKTKSAFPIDKGGPTTLTKTKSAFPIDKGGPKTPPPPTPLPPPTPPSSSSSDSSKCDPKNHRIYKRDMYDHDNKHWVRNIEALGCPATMNNCKEVLEGAKKLGHPTPDLETMFYNIKKNNCEMRCGHSKMLETTRDQNGNYVNTCAAIPKGWTPTKPANWVRSWGGKQRGKTKKRNEKQKTKKQKK